MFRGTDTAMSNLHEPVKSSWPVTLASTWGELFFAAQSTISPAAATGDRCDENETGWPPIVMMNWHGLASTSRPCFRICVLLAEKWLTMWDGKPLLSMAKSRPRTVKVEPCDWIGTNGRVTLWPSPIVLLSQRKRDRRAGSSTPPSGTTAPVTFSVIVEVAIILPADTVTFPAYRPWALFGTLMRIHSGCTCPAVTETIGWIGSPSGPMPCSFRQLM